MLGLKPVSASQGCLGKGNGAAASRRGRVPRSSASGACPARGRQVLDTLVEIQERHAAVRELEKSLLDLHQIFLDMAVLVEAQGDMLDNIESQARALTLTLPYFYHV
jgi:hypothetical protein